MDGEFGLTKRLGVVMDRRWDLASTDRVELRWLHVLLTWMMHIRLHLLRRHLDLRLLGRLLRLLSRWLSLSLRLLLRSLDRAFQDSQSGSDLSTIWSEFCSPAIGIDCVSVLTTALV